MVTTTIRPQPDVVVFNFHSEKEGNHGRKWTEHGRIKLELCNGICKLGSEKTGFTTFNTFEGEEIRQLIDAMLKMRKGGDTGTAPAQEGS